MNDQGGRRSSRTRRSAKSSRRRTPSARNQTNAQHELANVGSSACEQAGWRPAKTSRCAPTDRQLLAVLAPTTYHESGLRTDTRTAGQGGETLATAMLVREGYTIVEQNYRCSLGELDVVARDGDVLAFVEVRSRADERHGHAAEMVTPDKQRQVVRVAECYLLDREPPDEHMRFDVVAITGDVIDLIKDAWRL